MPKSTARIGTENYTTKITALSGNEIFADEPVEDGGQNKGPRPTELFAAGLASCICITLRMYANRKEWPLDEVEVEVDFEYDRKAKKSTIVKTIRLFGELDEEQKKRLYVIAEKCPVSMALSNPIHIDTIHD